MDGLWHWALRVGEGTHTERKERGKGQPCVDILPITLAR